MSRFLKYIDINISYAQRCRLAEWHTPGVDMALHVLYYILNGTADIVIDGKKYSLKQGDMMICPLTSYISYKKTSDILEKYYIHFYLGVDGIPCFADKEFEYVVNFGYDEEIIKKLECMSNGCNKKNMYNRFEYRSMLLEILSEFFKRVDVKEKKLTKSEYKCWKALGYISCNAMKKILVEDTASYVGVHSKYLSKLFKSTFGENINYYINNLKIEQIISIINYRDVLLKEIAGISEYSNYATLKKWFRKLRGFDIKELRANHYLKRPESGEYYDTVLHLTPGRLTLNIKESIPCASECLLLAKKELWYVPEGCSVPLDTDECETTLFNFSLLEEELEKPDKPEKLPPEKNKSFEKLISLSKKENLSFAELLEGESYLLDILSGCIDSKEGDEEKGDIFTEILMYIESNIQKPFSVFETAEFFNEEPERINTIFKMNTGISISEYVSALKYEKAINLLKEKSIPIKKIAEAIGFTSYEGFRKFIKRKTEMYPKELREKLNQRKDNQNEKTY